MNQLFSSFFRIFSGAAPRAFRLLEQIGLYGRMIKFSHSVFALPFALAALILARRTHPVSAGQFFWIIAAMVAARGAAMGVNRAADAAIDARNPRTAGREIPAGRLSLFRTWVFSLAAGLVFIGAAAMLGETCRRLSVPILAFLCLYSWTKRFTWLAHVWLGAAISIAPAATWIAVADALDLRILWLSAALMTNIAGFDILYACQDADFDRSAGLFSIPSRFGVSRAFSIARLIHVMTFLSFFCFGLSFGLGPAWYVTLVLIAGLLILEHRLVNPLDLSRIHAAFFQVNSVISLLLLLGVAVDEILRWTGG